MRKQKYGLIFYEKKQGVSKQVILEVLSWVFYTVIAVVSAALIVSAFGYRIVMTGASMMPGIRNGQYVLVNRVIYHLSSPKRGDMVVFYPNGNVNAHLSIKRVIGLPGETVRIEDGRVYIDDRPESDPDHKYDTIQDPGIAANGITLGNKEYFVLGDRRNTSEDSRSAGVGAVHADAIIGKAWFVYGGKK